MPKATGIVMSLLPVMCSERRCNSPLSMGSRTCETFELLHGTFQSCYLVSNRHLAVVYKIPPEAAEMSLAAVLRSCFSPPIFAPVRPSQCSSRTSSHSRSPSQPPPPPSDTTRTATSISDDRSSAPPPPSPSTAPATTPARSLAPGTAPRATMPPSPRPRTAALRAPALAQLAVSAGN